MKLVRSSEDLYREYCTRMRKNADVKNTLALMQWDQETYLPSRGASFRAQQIATLSQLSHDLSTESSLGDLLNELILRDDLDIVPRRNVQLSQEDYVREKKFSGEFVHALSEAVSRAFYAWIDARKENNFAVFESSLTGLLALKRQQADLLGYSANPYDALLDEYEKGATVSMLDSIFDELLPQLKSLLDRITASPQVDDQFLHQQYEKQHQWNFGMEVIKKLGFDLEAGRQDLSEHPFTTSFNPNDVRLTTRIDENDFANMLWSCIHETGHGLYEQGLPVSEYGLPSGEYASLSIHESQSRLWENNVGRSQAFWSYWYAPLQKQFPTQLGKVSGGDFYSAINKVQPSLIRTEADELTYHFHVMIRYGLEKRLISGDLQAADIPAWWNEQYRNWLGVKVPDDKRGCLQDVHWSHGSFGYFPTYSLGSLYAAQLFATLQFRFPDLEKDLENGDSTLILAWLRENIHSHGRTFNSESLCLQACGQKLDIDYFLRYALDKYRNIYNF